MDGDELLEPCCDDLGVLHVLAFEGDVRELLRPAVEVPLAGGVEGVGRVFDEVAGVLFVGGVLRGAEFGEVGVCIEAKDGDAEVAPGHEADYFYVGVSSPLLLDVAAVEVQAERLVRGAVAVEAKEGIVGSSGTGGSIAVDEELVEVGAGGVSCPGCAGGFGPAGDDAASADDGVLAVCGLPDGVAVLGAEVERLGEKYVPVWMVMVMGPVVPERRCARAASRASASVLTGPVGETVIC